MINPSRRERRRQKMARWTVGTLLFALVATIAAPALAAAF